MKRRKFIALSGLIGLSAPVFSAANIFNEKNQNLDKNEDFTLPDLNNLRRLSQVIVGDLPLKINVTKVADTIRPASVVVKGESENEKNDFSENCLSDRICKRKYHARHRNGFGNSPNFRKDKRALLS